MPFCALVAALVYLLQLPVVLLALLVLPGLPQPREAYLQPNLTDALTELICVSLLKKVVAWSVCETSKYDACSCGERKKTDNH